MLLVTTDTINGKKIEELCVVSGGTVQTVNLFRDFGSGRFGGRCGCSRGGLR